MRWASSLYYNHGMTKKSPTHEVIRTEDGEIELIAEGSRAEMTEALARCLVRDPEDGPNAEPVGDYRMQPIDWSRE